MRNHPSRSIGGILNFRNHLHDFLLRDTFRDFFHLGAVFCAVAAVSILCVAPPDITPVSIFAICSTSSIVDYHCLSSLPVAGLVLGFVEMCISKISYPRPQCSSNSHKSGNCRSISSMFCLMILYCSGKWSSAARR